MAYIQREGGDRFVIPSYRDVLAKRKGRLKADILELSSKYGEYMTFHRRSLAHFDVAFSHDTGYLFGECVWSYFKRPSDLIYCEAIPDTTDAYLVIVKDGGVYLDGIFSIESIPEELVVFTTQKVSFEIYAYGEVNISQEVEEGKFSLDPAQVKSFNVLEQPLFATLPTVKAYQLQLVDVVLRQQGIGVFPIRYLVMILVFLGLGYMAYSFVNMHKRQVMIVNMMPPPENPYSDYNKALQTPAPDQELILITEKLMTLFTLPGWIPTDIVYNNGLITAAVMSKGTNTAILYDWARANAVKVDVTPKGFSLSMNIQFPPKRRVPAMIYPLERIIADMVDRMALVAPGNILNIGAIKTDKAFKEVTLTISLQNAPPQTLNFLAEQLKDLPLVLTNVSIRWSSAMTGTVTLQAYGN